MCQALKRAGGVCIDAPMVKDSYRGKVQVAIFTLPESVSFSDILSDLAKRGVDALIWQHSRIANGVVIPVD